MATPYALGLGKGHGWHGGKAQAEGRGLREGLDQGAVDRSGGRGTGPGRGRAGGGARGRQWQGQGVQSCVRLCHRKAFDDVLSATSKRKVYKSGRDREMQEKRRKMADSLEERERAAAERAAGAQDESDVDKARDRLKKELERLRKAREVCPSG